MTIKMLASLIFASTLLGCATSSVPFQSATPVPQSNLLEGYSKYAQAGTDKVRVIIVRDTGIYAAGLNVKLMIDGTPIAKLSTGERLELFLKPDAYIFGAEPSPNLGGSLSEKDVNIVSGRLYAFRISSDQNSGFIIQPSTQLQ